MSTFQLYEALWRRIQAEDVFVCYNGLLADEGGYFVPEGPGVGRKPEIGIVRPYYREPMYKPSELTCSNGQIPDIRNELLTLAHEYGHYLSWKTETPREKWELYHSAAFHRNGVARQSGWEAVSKALSDAEKRLIVDEETLAWKLGRQFIPDDLLAEYDEKARSGVHNHRYRLGLDELWPEDVAGG